MKRIGSIDFTRGLVMIIMALDHVRDFMHTTALTQSPTNLLTTTPGLFLTRWITYLCAPTFVFLSGTSAYIYLKRNNDFAGTKKYLLSRGIWLLILEFTIINFSLWFDIRFRFLIQEVISVIGIGFIVLSFLLKINSRIIGITGLVILFGHNLLQGVSFPNGGVSNVIFSVLFRPNVFTVSPNFTFFVAYPVIPWLGILLTGFGSGQFFELATEKRKRLFEQIGLAALVLFCLVRYINIYGDPSKWAVQKSALFTVLSFVNVTKYPPSLLFVLLFFGLMFIVLAISDKTKNRFTEILSVYGKVPLFYFVLHLYLIHSVMFIMLYTQGFALKDLQFGPFSNGSPKAGSGVELPVVYLIWIAVVVVLYPLCKMYGKYKMANRQNKLLHYL